MFHFLCDISVAHTFMLMNMNRRTYYSDPVTKKVKWTVLLSFHLIVSTGVAILVTGASNLQSSNVKPSDVSKDTSLVKLGMALLTIAWAMIAIISVWTLARPAQFTTSKSSTAVGTRVSVPPECIHKCNS